MASLTERIRNLPGPQKALVGGGAVAVLIAIIAVIALAGGGGDDPEPTTTSGPTTTTTLPPPAPLTGLPDFEGVANRPAISIKIGNNPEARPQQGIDVADVLYEEEVEGRVTRFLAVFQSVTPERVGPIRSVRLMDGLIARPIGGIFVYSGGANVPERISRLDAAGLTHLNETQLAGIDGARILDSSHGNGVRPNILFADLTALWERFTDLPAARPLFSFLGQGESFAGDPVSEVTVPVGSGGFNPTWKWDDDAKAWQRFLGDRPYLAKSGEQVAFENLIVQFVEVSGEESLVVGSGEAAVLSDGKIVRGTWERASEDEPARFFDANGAEIRLTPGRTWVHLPRAGGTIRTAP